MFTHSSQSRKFTVLLKLMLTLHKKKKKKKEDFINKVVGGGGEDSALRSNPLLFCILLLNRKGTPALLYTIEK